MDDIDITSFTPCLDHDNVPGVMCGSECRQNYLWCDDNTAASCDTGSGLINTTDPRLCSNPHVWRNVSCSQYFDDKRVYSYGVRCTGQIMQCVYPWYTSDKGNEKALEEGPHLIEAYSAMEFKDLRYRPHTQCSDKSDQVFNISLTCRQHLQQQVDFHTETFCNLDYVRDRNNLICTNKTQWLSTQDPAISDPHLCQSSCSIPDPDCLACTESSYFLCPRSGQCVHPDLVCDGHPQCTEGEDEDLDLCHVKNMEKGAIKTSETLRCRSLLYDNMDIHSIPCNGVTECSDGSDENESFCNLLKL